MKRDKVLEKCLIQKKKMEILLSLILFNPLKPVNILEIVNPTNQNAYLSKDRKAEFVLKKENVVVGMF